MDNKITDEQQQYEDEWNAIDEKVILAQILTELQQIRLMLSDAETDAQSDSSSQATYQCTLCPGDVTVPETKREQHAQSEHNAPPGDELGIFEQVKQ